MLLSSAGVPDVLLGAVDQETGPAEVCRETEGLVDALLKHALDSSRVFGEVREMFMSEDRCHEVNDGVDIGRHFTECPNYRDDDPAALAIGLQLKPERPFRAYWRVSRSASSLRARVRYSRLA